MDFPENAPATGYRVAAEDDPDPLSIDVELCASQRYKQRLLLSGVFAVLTVGFLLPVFVYTLLAGRKNAASWAGKYSARIARGTLVAGTATESRTVPLDAIVDLSVRDGYVTTAIRGSQALQILGLRDPAAAISAILDARDEHVRRLRGSVEEDPIERQEPIRRRAGE